MNREIKYKAWFKDLKVMLDNVAIYPDGMLGMDYTEFRDAVGERGCVLDEGVIRMQDEFDIVSSYLEGDDWIWLEPSRIEWLEYTGMKDKNIIEIYEGDVIARRGMKNTYVDYYRGKWVMRSDETNAEWRLDLHNQHRLHIEVVGNMFEHPELLK